MKARPGRRVVEARAVRFGNLRDAGPLDVLITGAGISGAAIYQELARSGYRVGIVDRGDFASGTSQASGMLIWGGLLYLRNLDFATVVALCRSRQRLLEKNPEDASVVDLHFSTGHLGVFGKAFMWSALQLYWGLGGCHLAKPRFCDGEAGPSLVYQEGMLRESDSRFVLGRIAGGTSEDCVSVNHCELVSASRDAAAACWRVGLKDRITGDEHAIRAKVLVNAAGVWADDVDRIAGLVSPCKHVFSKGVYLMFPRNGERAARVHPMVGRQDVLTHVPWGPVMMWGPTETPIRDLKEGFAPSRDDVGFLLAQARSSLRGRVGMEDVVSMRSGVRPLAVPRNFEKEVYPLDLSRKHRVVVHAGQHAVSVFGGKFTSGSAAAGQVASAVGRWVQPRHAATEWVGREVGIPRNEGGCGDGFVTPEHARDSEFCATLEDYLRRRTQIAQWTPRMGLGRAGENRSQLLEMAAAFADDEAGAIKMTDEYEETVRRIHDSVLEAGG